MQLVYADMTPEKRLLITVDPTKVLADLSLVTEKVRQLKAALDLLNQSLGKLQEKITVESVSA